MEKYRYWDILEHLPDGWVIDKTAGSPAPNTVFITNGKSVLNGQKRALLKVKSNYSEKPNSSEKIEVVVKNVKTNKEVPFPSKKVNILARKKFQEQLLKEIRFDLMVCEIEGWDKKEYIKEIKQLLNGVDLSGKRKERIPLEQPDLFDVDNFIRNEK